MSERIKKVSSSFAEKECPAIAITAASGKLGHAVARALANQGLSSNTRLAARDPNKLRLAGMPLFDVVAADYENGRSMVTAFSGVDTALIISSMGTDTTRIRQHRIAIDAAISAGVKRIVYTSSACAMQVGALQWTTAHADTERYLQQCGIPYTILRVGTYFSNFDYLFLMALQCGRLFFPNVTIPISLVTQDDAAAAIFKVLTTPKHDKKTYEILAKEPVTIAELAQIMMRILGRRVIPAIIPAEAFITQFKKHQMLPDHIAKLLGDFYSAIATGACAHSSADMERLTGQPATSAEAYLRTLIYEYSHRLKAVVSCYG